MNTTCDTETCGTCGQESIEGNDANDECTTCSGDTSLLHLLRLTAAGVTRNKTTGRFAQIKEK